MTPMEMLDKIRQKANITDSDYEKQTAVKLNKAGKIKFQLLAMSPDYLFRARTQHFIPKTPDCDDPNEKILVVNCKGDNCPVCDAAYAFKNSGVKLEDVNNAYKSKYPYTNLRSVFTQAEHFLVCAKILADNAEEGNYLPKDASVGSTQLIQLSKSALSSLMSAYEDFLDDYTDDNGGDVDSLPPLFGIFDGENSVKSFVINCRVQTQPWSYNFTFGKAIETKIEEVDKEKLALLEKGFSEPTEDYVAKVIERIKNIQNYFVGLSANINTIDSNTKPGNNENKMTRLNDLLDEDDDEDLVL